MQMACNAYQVKECRAMRLQQHCTQRQQQLQQQGAAAALDLVRDLGQAFCLVKEHSNWHT